MHLNVFELTQFAFYSSSCYLPKSLFLHVTISYSFLPLPFRTIKLTRRKRCVPSEDDLYSALRRKLFFLTNILSCFPNQKLSSPHIQVNFFLAYHRKYDAIGSSSQLYSIAHSISDLCT